MNVRPSTTSRPLFAALGTSVLVHALLSVALVAFIHEHAASPGRLATALTARLVTPAPAVAEPSPVTALPPAPAPVQSMQERPPPGRVTAPLPKPKPAESAVSEYVNVHHTVEADAALDPSFEQAIASELANLRRTTLAFDEPPAIALPVEALRGVPQWRIRTLVQVSDAGTVQLVRIVPYEPRFLHAIGKALEISRAKPADGATTVGAGWAIVDFWFELATREPAR